MTSRAGRRNGRRIGIGSEPARPATAEGPSAFVVRAGQRYRRRVVTDIETFQETLTASGLPPVRSGRHDRREFRAGVVSRALGPLKVIELVTPEGECFRDARSSRSADEALWQIELMVRGRARVEQGRGTADLLQLFVVVWRDDRWVVAALENARLLSLKSMAALESLADG
jgi:hypothetical protein